MPALESYVIAGAGLAGAKAAQTLREEGFEGNVLLVGSETERPYERPALSKSVLLNREPADSVYVHEEAFYRDHDITLLTGTTVLSIDRDRRRTRLSDGSELRYDRLLLATGAAPRRLRVPGASLPGVHTLRTLGDSLALREQLREGDRHVVVVGAGWIGLETAAAAREYGNRVTVVDVESTPLHVPLGAEVGAHFAALHRRKGVEFVFEDGLFAVRGTGSVDHVTTSRGAELPADLVVVAVGVAPGTGLAKAAGLKVDNGVVVDESLRTSDPDIFAAGDVANAHHPLYQRHIRTEHWANALHSGPAAARSMLGREVAYDRVPYFYSDQYDLGMEFSGFAEPGCYDRIVYRGDPAGGEYLAFWLRAGRVVAGMNVNVWDVTQDLQALIRAQVPVDRTRLADPKTPLAELLPG
ncbi:NAD(P)/FAD-dependent oxidoreductase [Actinocorallia longicatena]|uniref:FAD-dependent oxidoreductase n=1 Tax=Actinocorallia longicatena TaxID=111803 RepID=A0ABP6QK48_9ACTN